MEYGCKIWNEQGDLILDTNDYVARIIYVDTKPGDAQGSIYLPDADGTRPLLLVVPASTSNSNICLNVSITSWGLLSWKPVWDGWYHWINGQWAFDPIRIISESTLITVCVCDEKVW